MPLDPPDHSASAAPAPPAAFDTRAGYVDALRHGLHAAMQQGARRIVCCDVDFADWPLDDEAVLQALVAWLKRPQRQLTLLAGRYDELPRRHPRFTAWRRDWAHAVDAWQPPEEEVADGLPSLLVADCGVAVQLVDRTHWRGRFSADRREALVWLDAIDARLQRSQRAFAVQCLGL